MRLLRRYLLAGLVVVLPTVLTAYVLWFLFTKLDGILGSFLRERTGWSFPGIGLAAIFVILLVAGMMASNLIGKRLIRFVQKGLESIPLFNRVYVAVRQISETLLSERSNVFRQVALVEYPRRGIFSLCFVTSENSGEIASKLARKTVNVFLPTSPNPTSGFMLVVPAEDIIPLEMSVEDGMKMVISAGSYTPYGTYGYLGRHRLAESYRQETT
jgi:uncharacterized membrane protein